MSEVPEFLGEKFICGICGEHRPVVEKTEKVVYLGLYGTEWQVCVNCEGQIK